MIDQLASCTLPACGGTFRTVDPARRRYCSTACLDEAQEEQAYSLNPVMYPPGAPTVQKW